jgi:citrate lyase beta subunit
MTFRSFLFVPGARPDRFAKAFAAGADAVCIDLEDAVPPPEKAAAREATLAALRQDRQARPAVGLRLNALRTPAGVADLAALAASDARPDFVMMPKVAHAEEAAIADTFGWLPLHEAAYYRAPLEVMQALLDAHPVAVSTPTARGYLPLHCANEDAHVDAFKLLLRVFPEAAYAAYIYGSLPLYYATLYGSASLEVVVALEAL